MWVKSCSSVTVGTLHAGLNEYGLIDIRGKGQCRVAREWTMNTCEVLRNVLLRTTVAALCLLGIGIATTPLAGQAQDQDEEVQLGQEVFNELKAKGEIIESSRQPC